VTGLDQIGGHRSTHIAEADESDIGHLRFPPSAFVFCRVSNLIDRI
jgi:hypothetical protein